MQSLLQELAGPQAPANGAATTQAPPPSQLLTRLNDAFTRLIGDLKAGAGAASDASGGVSSGTTGSGTSTSGTDSGGATSPTPALQSFLTNLLQDLQANNGGATATLGATVNVTA